MKPKLIILNGAVASGKTTIALHYIAEHTLALHVNGDQIISSMGNWLAEEDTARQLTFNIIKSMIKTHLASGHDVIVPYLLVRPHEAADFEQIAAEQGADFYEFLLEISKEESVQRTLVRGTWGDEAGAPPVTNTDIPIIEGLYDQMITALEQRPNTRHIDSTNDVDKTYHALNAAILS
jgi:predicted kinase